ncbi:MAG: hypothetical protein J6I47_06610 [Ruminococcus sp.]|nr:hypothetical protein [Ruminococcus sp.]
MSDKIEISAELLMKMSKEIKDKIRNSNFTTKYILSQTGIKETDLNNFLSILDDECDKTIEDELCSKIYDRIITFFDNEKTSGTYKEKSKEEFFEIHKALREHFKLKNKEQELIINQKLDEIFNSLIMKEKMEQEFGLSNYIFDRYSIDELEEKHSIHKLLKDKIEEWEYNQNIINYGFPSTILENEVIKEPLTEEEKAAFEEKCDKLKKEISHLRERELFFKEKDRKYTEEYINIKINEIPYSFSDRKKYSKKNIERHKFTIPFQFNADQQRAILEAYYDKCTDDEGYLLPDYFGTGIQLLGLIDEKPIEVVTGWWKIKFIKRAEPWKSNDKLNNYDWGEKLPDIDKDDPVYKMILLHKNVFFKDTFAEKTREISRMIKYSSVPVRSQIIDYLKDEYGIFVPKNSKDSEYYKAVAEFFDILSMNQSIESDTQYNMGQIYRAVYEIAAESNGEVAFSNELVKQAYTYIKFKPVHWMLHMYVFHYMYKHKSLDDLILFIEEKNQEYDDKEIE